MKPPLIATPEELQRFVKKLLLEELEKVRRELRQARHGTVASLRYHASRVKKLEALIELFDGQPLPKTPPRTKPLPKQLDMISQLRKRVSARAPRRFHVP